MSGPYTYGRVAQSTVFSEYVRTLTIVTPPALPDLDREEAVTDCATLRTSCDAEDDFSQSDLNREERTFDSHPEHGPNPRHI
jgi:hypothetical protein